MPHAEKENEAKLLFPDGFCYYHEHTWAKGEQDEALIGISHYAQDKLGEILFIELPRVGDTFQQGDIFGCAESTKTTSSLYMPVSGTIIAVNEALEDKPEIVNESPYEEGWLVRVRLFDSTEMKALLSRDDYISQLK